MQLTPEQQELEQMNAQQPPRRKRSSAIANRSVKSEISTLTAAATGATQDAKNDALAYAKTYSEVSATLREKVRAAGQEFWASPSEDAIDDAVASVELEGMDSDFFGEFFGNASAPVKEVQLPTFPQAQNSGPNSSAA